MKSDGKGRWLGIETALRGCPCRPICNLSRSSSPLAFFGYATFQLGLYTRI